jgi:hypothetical protein
MKNLLPCPFCGGAGIPCSDGATHHGKPDLPHYIRCDNLLCCGFNTSQGFRTREIAAEAWNERAHALDKQTWIGRPTGPGFYWCRGERKSQLAIAHVGERVVWDAVKQENVSHGWWAQIVPGGAALPLDALPSYEFSGPLKMDA